MAIPKISISCPSSKGSACIRACVQKSSSSYLNRAFFKLGKKAQAFASDAHRPCNCSPATVLQHSTGLSNTEPLANGS
eukprot:223852-Pelagomonas_calceolata.AAC.5